MTDLEKQAELAFRGFIEISRAAEYRNQSAMPSGKAINGIDGKVFICSA